MSTVAIIRIRMPSGAVRSFQADRIDVADSGLVTASGVWRGTRKPLRRTYVWSPAQILQIRMMRERVA
jgi:hypothetical protein